MMAFVETGFGIANLEVGDSRRVLAKESGDGFFCGKAAFIGTVSYTHLTLPTILLV